jgi:hypothetical protein
MSQEIFNPAAPPYLNGFNPASPQGCEDVDAAMIWPPSGGFQVMTGNQVLNNQVIVLSDADEFIWRAFIFAVSGPGFLYRVQDDAGNYISDGFLYSNNTPGTWANPFPQFPAVSYRRGPGQRQAIHFDIINVAAVNQNVQVVFRGPNRYRRGY